MTTVTPDPSSAQPSPDDRPGVVKATLLTVSSFGTAIGTLLAVSGVWAMPDTTVRFAIAVCGAIAALTLAVPALYVWRHR